MDLVGKRSESRSDSTRFTPSITMIYLNVDCTLGAADTLTQGMNRILEMVPTRSSLPTICMDCDTFYTAPILDMYRSSVHKNAVFYMINEDPCPIYSYIVVNEQHIITDIQEKNKISDKANTGMYCFDNMELLRNYTQKAVMKSKVINQECYTSMAISEMIQDGHIVVGRQMEARNVFHLGTPEQLENYCQGRFACLFDLDGTLVHTDSVYYHAWNIILGLRGILLTRHLFDTSIHGKSDTEVIQTLLLHCIHETKNISIEKDMFVLEHLDQIIAVEGAESFLRSLYQQGHPIMIVTNSNRCVAEAIVQSMKWNHLIYGVVVGSECRHSKPYPDPYVMALEQVGISSSRAIIFEDSKSGLLSAVAVSPRCVVGIKTMYDPTTLINCGANATVTNYVNVSLSMFLPINHSDHKQNEIISWIHHCIGDAGMIYLHKEKLKGGFIADVYAVSILENPPQAHQMESSERLATNKSINDRMSSKDVGVTKHGSWELVVKIKNTKKTFLSDMSHRLNLYEREMMFYDVISDDVPFEVPIYLGLIKNNENTPMGVLLENVRVEEPLT